MSKKQVKEELEHDILLDTFSKAQSFYDQNRSAIIGAAVAILLIIGGSIGYYYYTSAQEAEAQQLMTNPTKAYLNQDYQTALTGSEQDFTVGFKQIIDNYSITDAANLARYYAAVCEFNLGNPQNALTYLENYEVPQGIMGVGPISFRGVVLTDIGNHSQAADTYVKAAEWNVNDATTPYNYLEAAKAFQKAGNNAKAKEYAQKVISEYSNSSQVADAQKVLGMLATAK
ncbi:Tetratricopeptide repeat-containing protein [Fodinibius salinus]|uniref:Tetratricopeptide repeat-containing protein n=1 Tax=Fodinibius salinus TaxID=860790 RepID=A0A5D3YML1_9BACT|nr:tetratricopeptide repeat protein [Fodinibius salinus]TYP95415.1 Tetratricopeptide repeat-containing protein [Fodinibius salinus]